MRLALALVALALLAPLGSPTEAPRFFAPALDDAPAPLGAVSAGEEPMILVAPDGTLLVGDTAGVHRSRDGGATWQRSAHPFLPGLFTDGRALALDDAGRLYAAHTQGQFIGVAVSEDLGATWAWTSHVVTANSIADRPWLSARGDGEVVLIWYAELVEHCAYSTDAGRTWLTRTLGTGGNPNAGSVHLDAQGRVWYTTGAYAYRWNAPCTGRPQTLGLGLTGPQILDQLAVNDQAEAFSPAPSLDAREMRLRGMVDMTHGTLRTLTVSPPELKSNTFGAVAARADGSEVAVAWYGSTTAGNPAGSFSGSWDVYVARVTGFFTASPTVKVEKVTTTPNHVGGFCMNGIGCSAGESDRDLLDYFGVAYDAEGNVHVAYGHDGSTSNAVVRYARLAAGP